MANQETHAEASFVRKHRKAISIIGVSLAGIAILGTSTTVYANEWKSNEHQFETSQYQMVQAQHKLDKVVKTYEDNYKALKEKGVTPQGSLAVVTPSSAKLDNKSRSDLISSITNDKPTITSTSLWTLKDNIHKINQITKEIDKETSDTNARINMIKTELKKQEIKDARKKLTDKINKATRLYKESEGKVEDDKTRKDLKKWIDDSNTLLSKKDANVDLAVYSSNLGKADDLMKKVKSSRDAYDQLAASMANETTVSGDDGGQSATYDNQYGWTQPAYGNQTVNQPQINQPQPQMGVPPQGNGYDHAVAESCNATNGEGQANTCQGAIDRGGMVDVQYYNGSTHIYSQHNGTGGEWMNNLKPGDTVSFGGKQYTVNNYNEQGAKTAPSNGYYAQTCNENGNHLIGLTPKN